MAFQRPGLSAYPLLKRVIGYLTGVLDNTYIYERAGIACIPAHFFLVRNGEIFPTNWRVRRFQ